MKKIIIFIQILVLLSLNLFSDERKVIQKANEYLKQQNYEAALEVIDSGIEEIGETSGLLGLKYYLLMDLKRYNDALEVGLKKENLLKGNPTLAALNDIAIANTYLHLNYYDKALERLNKAVDRGFITYSILESDEALPEASEAFKIFKVLENNDRYKSIIKKIKDNIGIDKTAKDFTTELFSEEKFTLSKQKGKVVLIDFWATWCLPCRREIPLLKKYYDEFKNKGFEIIGISLDTERQVIEKFITEKKIEWKIGFSGKGWEDDTFRMYGVDVIPSYWLVDKNGILRGFNLRRERLREAINRLVIE
jgi:thiol-disulfide isomerase/thioredoxin